MVGDIRKVLRHRYGRTLPDDDAGRDDIRLLLHPVSAAPHATEDRLRFEIEEWAPWMSADEAEALMTEVRAMPRWRYGAETAMAVGLRLNITAAERERLRAWQIRADQTETEREARRKAKHRQRQVARRRKAGVRPRQEYLATSLSKSKPWEAEGISRAAWYQRRKTSPCQTKENNHGTDLSRPATMRPCQASTPLQASTASADKQRCHKWHCPLAHSSQTTDQCNGRNDEARTARPEGIGNRGERPHTLGAPGPHAGLSPASLFPPKSGHA